MPITVTKPRRSYEEIFTEIFEDSFPKFKEYELHIAEAIKEKVIKNLQTNIYGYKLSKEYSAFKEKHNLNPGILQATGQYLNEGIEVVETDTGYVVQVVDIMHEPIEGKGENTLHMRELAHLLEYGADKMPPFPHWRPVLLEFQNIYGTVSERFDAFVDEVHNITMNTLANEEFETKEI